ncbi:MAG: hypothetical protein ABIO29_00425 [Sphingomicrobium sp.]
MTDHRTQSHRLGWLRAFSARAVAVPATLFGAAMIGDWIYSATEWMMWSNAAAWLLLGGLMGAVVALLALALLWRNGGESLVGVVVLGAAIAVETVNFLVHFHDGFTSVVPVGLTLSVVGAALTLVAAWLARHSAIEARA